MEETEKETVGPKPKWGSETARSMLARIIFGVFEEEFNIEELMRDLI